MDFGFEPLGHVAVPAMDLNAHTLDYGPNAFDVRHDRTAAWIEVLIRALPGRPAADNSSPWEND
ncbi:hypothetical protein [Bradyrhizobium erythrophlei]|uniref:hypothetical protein n=1 Tax=Bradyrhizobium erythrophlei TaxID=1437360 RepID=UPI0009A7A09D|nr:hypothetical protein [Bradyrhizobium erythrophlei]